jgi:Fe-S cluster assembly protein SufD
MTQTVTRFDNYLADFQALQQDSAAAGPAWLRDLRDRAWSRFAALGFPTARRGNEKWKYTNVAPIAKSPFAYSRGLAPDGALEPGWLNNAAPWEKNWINLVFVDGSYSRELSTGPGAARGCRAASLAEAVGHDGRAVEQHLASHASMDEDAFTALNTAFIRDGAFVHISDGCAAEQPIHLLFVTTGRAQPGVTFPRTLVVLGRHSSATIVESYLSPTLGHYFTDAVTEIVLGEGAEVDHSRLLLESPGSFHVGTSRVHQSGESSLFSATFETGAAMVRNDFKVLLDGPGSRCTLNGLYLTSDNQHVDNLISIDHAKPHTTSRLSYKGILDGKSRAVFGGEVLVRKDAQKTDAHQTDRNLLLSKDAEVDSKPSLLIYADDVKCGHGATAGHLDETALFYLRSRGLDLETAGRMLVHAFAEEIIETVKLQPLRDFLSRLFLNAIPAKSLLFGGGP